ncbi:hypothetical protein [Pseudonocardia spinosispora]|uniref:hypothetical protein n=1 Tax=Pseudonocardia spinosispora TaxID=103441 RepID=UPI00040C9CD2|nr:hypothetical protein [Pseudonocardia spinosispora]
MYSHQNDATDEDGMSPLASVMAAMPDVYEQLIAEHVADSSGRCMSCRNHGTAGVPWPCTLRVIAEDARSVHLAELAAYEDPCGLAAS